MITVFADDRENSSGIIEEIKDNKVRVKLKRLEVGDFLISDRVVVERKTGNDFIQSIIDGRLFTQAEELVDNFEKPIIIVEGNFYGIRNIHENALRGAISALVLDFGIPVIQTQDLFDTAALIAYLAKREQTESKRSVRLQGKKRKMPLEKQQQFIVESLPGVGPNLAKNLLKQFGSIEGVFVSNERELREVDKIGKKKAKKIRKILTKEYLKD